MSSRPARHAVTWLVLVVAASAGCRGSRRETAATEAGRTDRERPGVALKQPEVTAPPTLAASPAWPRIMAAWNDALEQLAGPTAGADVAQRERVLAALAETARAVEALLGAGAIRKNDAVLLRMGTGLLTGAVEGQTSGTTGAIARLMAQIPALKELAASADLDLAGVAAALPLLAQELARAERELANLPEHERASAEDAIDTAKLTLTNLRRRLPHGQPRYRGAGGQ
jgi:hypothetical protein